MADTNVAVQVISSGTPAYVRSPEAAKWPSGSPLISAFVSSILCATPIPSRDTVFLTRAHQRIMDRALRRSVRIIA